MIDNSKYSDTQHFYSKIESRYKYILSCLIEEDCKQVEYTRGELAAYSDILKECSRWKPKDEIFPH